MSAVTDDYNSIEESSLRQPKVLPTPPDHKPRPLTGESLAGVEDEAQELASRSKWGAAARTLLRAARAEPHNTGRWIQIAVWQRRNRDAKAAVRTLRTALRFNSRPISAPPKRATPVAEPHTAESVGPQDTVALWQALAETHMEAQAWVECIAACECLLDMDPKHHGAMEILATALLYSGQIDEATKVMHELLQISPRDPLHRIKLATLLHLQGHLGEALLEFARVTEAYPDAPFTQEAYEAIEALDKIQIQQILMRASQQPEYRQNLQRAFLETLDDGETYLSESGRETLRHMLWDGRSQDDEPFVMPRIH